MPKEGGAGVADVVQTMNMLDSRYRCDRCGSQAYVLAVLNIASDADELYFCNHHWHELQPALEPLCGMIVDETSRLQENRLTGAH
jgi:YHS domain-containing protein